MPPWAVTAVGRSVAVDVNTPRLGNYQCLPVGDQLRGRAGNKKAPARGATCDIFDPMSTQKNLALPTSLAAIAVRSSDGFGTSDRLTPVVQTTKRSSGRTAGSTCTKVPGWSAASADSSRPKSWS